MHLWLWLLVAAGSFLAFSIVLALTIAAILGSVSREVSQLLEAEPSVPVLATRAKTGLSTG